jgi:hypothetical protein
MSQLLTLELSDDVYAKLRLAREYADTHEAT